MSTVLIARLAREYARAIRAEEDAPTTRAAWRLAAASERALARLRAARAGLPLPESRQPRTARMMARGAFEALGRIGTAIARAMNRAAALRKALAASMVARVARKAAKLVRQALRSAVRAIARQVLAAIPTSGPGPTVTPAAHGVRMEARHESGSVITAARAYDLRTLTLLADCGYTDVRMVSSASDAWGWEPIATAINSATPSSAWYLPGGIGGLYPAMVAR